MMSDARSSSRAWVARYQQVFAMGFSAPIAVAIVECRRAGAESPVATGSAFAVREKFPFAEKRGKGG